MEHRGKVGNPKLFDIIGAQQFCVAVQLGLREHHKLLDIGCGSLRGGRFFIPYLLPGNYVCVEPNEGLIDAGIENESGHDILKIKDVSFHYFDDFRLIRTGRTFDFVLAQSILSHAGRDIVEKIFGQVGMVLNQGGMFLGTFFVGKDSKAERWLGNEVATYSTRFIESVAEKNGMRFNTLNYAHPAGQTWFVGRMVS